jgi:hypothetical protein
MEGVEEGVGVGGMVHKAQVGAVVEVEVGARWVEVVPGRVVGRRGVVEEVGVGAEGLQVLQTQPEKGCTEHSEQQS